MAEPSLYTSPVGLPQSTRTTTLPVQSNVTGSQKPGSDLLELTELLNEVPGWIRIPFRRFLRLKQRNWPLKTVRIYSQQYFNCLYQAY